ncbi:MAG: protein-L-isoaspartate(D-aspartate) O-methyltransferase [Chloroflexi bacterium]|nr:protein-L-isoaspartate(D-aspartate) O-methyltransferase [Chloroflexota bacterium]MBL7061556.1 protein-L-isoaspartate(D-aspartate) O-methyltransferase [Dehalococcoidia bacterium]
MGLEAARARLIDCLSREINDKRVLSAMARVPRERFVPLDYYNAAYEDMPLSIGFGQTISQPLIVALMTQALELKGDEKVLELGTGSGYQTAILAGLAKWVVSIERVPQLAESARQVLDSLGYTNIEIHTAVEALGWPDGAPYDAIIVTAGAPRVPDALLEQLALGGRLVIPVGSRWEQDLLRVTRRKKGNVVESLGGCRFVPLIGKGAWDEG